MVIIVLSLAPAKTSGIVSTYLMEISAGVYVGKLSTRVRTLLWEYIKNNLGSAGRAILVYPMPNPQGYNVEMENHGNRKLVDYDGLALIRKLAGDVETNSTGWSNASRYKRKYPSK